MIGDIIMTFTGQVANQSTFQAIIAVAYFLFNSFRVFTYLPQILAVSKDNTGAKAISILTWIAWTIANLTAGLYAEFVLAKPDYMLAIMSYGNAIGCGTVIGIVMYKRNKMKKLEQATSQEVKITNELDTSDSVKGLTQQSEAV
jgi:hypothetical protein